MRLLLAGIILGAMSLPLAALELPSDRWQALRQIQPDTRFAIDMPGSGGQGRPVLLQRLDVYAPGARILLIEGDGMRAVARSSRLHFVAVEGGPLALSMDRDGGAVSGAAWVDGEMMQLRGESLPSGAVRLALTPIPEYTEDGHSIEWTCSGARKPASSLPADLHKLMTNLAAQPAAAAGGASRQAVVAVDTDNEFMALKFGNNSTAATNYLADLFALMNGMYEMPSAAGGLDLRLLQGDTILRPSTTADPYSQSAAFEQLNEFSEHWRVTFPTVERAFSMLLSGKSSNPNSASGIAWILSSHNYCNARGTVFGNPPQTFGHYSVTQVFRFAGSTAVNDLRVISHELGHNLGADHTHCTSVDGNTFPTASNTMDRCYALESGRGCYGGAVSCPGGPGTIMSYCHFSAGAGGPNCGAANLLFHPGHVGFLGGRIAANFPTCITPISSGPFTLMVTKSGAGGGTVTSSPSGISCGSTCSAEYPSDTSVTLTASAMFGSYFGGWSGSGCGGSGTCSLVMSAERTVNASFALIPAAPAGLIFRSNFESWDPDF